MLSSFTDDWWNARCGCEPGRMRARSLEREAKEWKLFIYNLGELSLKLGGQVRIWRRNAIFGGAFLFDCCSEWSGKNHSLNWPSPIAACVLLNSVHRFRRSLNHLRFPIIHNHQCFAAVQRCLPFTIIKQYMAYHFSVPISVVQTLFYKPRQVSQ